MANMEPNVYVEEDVVKALRKAEKEFLPKEST